VIGIWTEWRKCEEENMLDCTRAAPPFRLPFLHFITKRSNLIFFEEGKASIIEEQQKY